MGANPAFVPTASRRPGVSTKGFNRGDGPPCGPNFSPGDGCYECWFCGRMPHRECQAYYPEDGE